jgi:Tol biopolymer transport system component
MRIPHIQRQFLLLISLLLTACSNAKPFQAVDRQITPEQTISGSDSGPHEIPHGQPWGIYRLDLRSQEVDLLFGSSTRISYLRLNHAGDKFAFSQTVGGASDNREEIFTLKSDGTDQHRLTSNNYWDLYPAWSPDDTSIAFLSQRTGSLGIFVMNSDGSNQRKLLDSEAHEADLDWADNLIAFTRDSRIWIMRSDGTEAHPISSPPRAGQWGAANLPFGDYDPRISPDASSVVFERLTGDDSPYGNYDLFAVNLATSEESRLTNTGYSQGLASWSHSGKQLIYVVSAIGQTGQYDLYLMNADGTDSHSITPAYFPPQFLCHWGIFSADDNALFFIGEWWEAG